VVSALPYVPIWSAGGFSSHSIAELRKWSANPLDFVRPPLLHPLWGAQVQQLLPQPAWIERTLYLGAVPLALALVALFHRRDAEAQREELTTSSVPQCVCGEQYRWVWAATALLGALLALGTDLHWDNQPLQPESPFWLPAAYLARLPFVSLLRTWTRFAIVPILFTALLAGLGAARIVQIAKGKIQKADAPQRLSHFTFYILPFALLALLVLDLLPGKIASFQLAPRPIDSWLAAQPGDFAVAFLPQIDDTTNYSAMYGSLFHGKHLPAYNHPSHLTPEYRRFRETADRFPESIEALRWMGLRYVLLERARYDGVITPAWSDVADALAREPWLRVVGEVDGVVVVEILH
jgi:hypothetical protein